MTESADAAQEFELMAAINRTVAELGVPDVVVYNAGLIRADKPGELGHVQHQAAYAVNVLGALTTAAISRRNWQRTPTGRFSSPGACLDRFQGW